VSVRVLVRSVMPLIYRTDMSLRAYLFSFGRENFDRRLFWETKDLREDLLLLLVWVVTIGELSILQCTVNNTTTNTLIDKQQNKKKRRVYDDEFFY